MQKSKLIKGRKGFTLVEVALAVAVGLIIIGGAVLGYNAVKDNASNSNARNRVLSAVTMVEEYAAANGGTYPTADATDSANQFTAMWIAKRPDDKASSPWGGPTGDPVTGAQEASAAVAGLGTAALAEATPTTTVTGVGVVGTADATQAANMIYAPVTGWANITAFSTSSATNVKNYLVSIYDKNGMPFWDIKGGK